MVTSILIFKGILEHSRAIEIVSRYLVCWHVPLVPITMLLPLLEGGGRHHDRLCRHDISDSDLPDSDDEARPPTAALHDAGSDQWLRRGDALALAPLPALVQCVLQDHAGTRLPALVQPCTVLVLAAVVCFMLMCSLLGR
jgi:hypothetical protein